MMHIVNMTCQINAKNGSTNRQDKSMNRKSVVHVRSSGRIRGVRIQNMNKEIFVNAC